MISFGNIVLYAWGHSRKPIPIRNPTAAGIKESLPIPSALSSAGESRLQKEAATITPAANPVSTRCILSEILSFSTNTIAAPRLVPRNGRRIPVHTCIFTFSTRRKSSASRTCAYRFHSALQAPRAYRPQQRPRPLTQRYDSHSLLSSSCEQ